MLVSKINFTSLAFDKVSLKQPQQTTSTTVAASENTPISETKNKSSNIKKYTLIGAAAILAALLIFKGKSVLNRIRKKSTDIPESKPHIPEVKTPEVATPEVKPPTVETVKPQVVEGAEELAQNNRYALIEEYDRLSKARAELRKKTKGRSLTPEEKAESERLRLSWGEVYHRLVPEHQSIVRTKTASDFANESEKQKYIMNYVLPRMHYSEESALDALDMFEQFGFRADYSNNSINTTITKLAEGTYSLPKECKTNKVLDRFIDVFGQFADNKLSKHPDDEELVSVLTFFAKDGHDISEETLVRGINLLKRIISQKWCHENLEENLIFSANSKFKDSQPVINALNELKVAAKDCIYILEAGDR